MNQENQQRLATAERAFQEGRHQEAIALLRAGASDRGSDPLVGVRLAEMLRRVPDEAGALLEYRKAALAYASRGQLPYAIALFKRSAPLSVALGEDEARRKSFLHELIHTFQHAGAEEPESGEEALELRDFPLFSELPKQELEAVIAEIVPLSLDAGKVIFRQRDQGGSLYLVTRGAVQISRTTEDGHEQALAQLEAGEFFGEVSFLTGSPIRRATVETIEPSELLELTPEVLQRITAAHPGVRVKLEAFSQRRRLDTLIAHIFPGLPAPERRRLAEKVEGPLHYDVGALVVEEGDTSQYMSIVLEGEVEVFTQSWDGDTMTLAELGPGQYFGEGSVLSGAPRTASVRASTPVTLYNIGRDVLLSTLSRHPEHLKRLEGVRTERVGATLQRLSGGMT